MITSRVKKQLLVFLIITLVGVTYVGARYARLDRLFYDSEYAVNAHFAQSGGIFEGAEVTYRGVGIGQVSDMRLIPDGVNVVLNIDNEFDQIPVDALALVGNKSAVGEQYVELQPRSDSGPYLKDGSVIETENTKTPVSTTEILTNASKFVNSVSTSDLRTVVAEMGAAFNGTGPDIAKIIDTTNAFIETANANFDVTKALIQDSNIVLRTQVAKGSAIRSFARDLSLFSDTLAGKDKELRALIDNGSATALELRTFLENNGVDLGQLINNLVTTGEVAIQHLAGTQQLLVLYPYAVAGAFTVTAPAPGGFDARFGLILQEEPHTCKEGYNPPDPPDPLDVRDKPMDVNARCTAPPNIDSRGAQNIPRAGANYRTDVGSPVATYDVETGRLVWSGEESDNVVYDGGAEQLLGKDSWKWLLLQPSMGSAG